MKVRTFGCSADQMRDIESHFVGASIDHLGGVDAQGWARSVGVTLPMVSVDTGCSSLWLSVKSALSYSSGATPHIEHDSNHPKVAKGEARSVGERQVENTPGAPNAYAESAPLAGSSREGLKSRDEAISQIDTRKAELLGVLEGQGQAQKRAQHVRQTDERRERV